MEKNPQVTSSQKSPVPKDLEDTTKVDVHQTQQSPATAVTNSSDVEQASGQKKELSKSTYQESSKSDSSRSDQGPSSATDSLATSKETLPHPIISVDIKKTMPYENKAVVPQTNKESEIGGDITPEVVASVVTSAVVTEAALTVNGTDGLVLNGNQLSSASSHVDAVVEQALNKISDNMSSGKTEIKSVSDDKPIPNGDINHSPVIDGKSETKSELLKEKVDDRTLLEGKTTPTTQIYKDSIALDDNKDDISGDIKTKEDSTCNGVPGIITVESISKKDVENKNTATSSDSKVMSDSATISINESASEVKSDGNKVENTDKVEILKESSQIIETVSTDISSKIKEIKPSIGKEIEEKANCDIALDNLTDSAKLNKMIDKTDDEVNNSKESLGKEEITLDSATETLDSSSKKVADRKIENEAKAVSISQNEEQQKKDHADDADNLKKKSDINEKEQSENEKNILNSNVTETDGMLSKESEDIDHISLSKVEEDILPKSEVNGKGDADSKTNNKSKDETVKEEPELKMSDMTSMMTSQILTVEMLNGEEESKVTEEVSIDSTENKAGKSSPDVNSCRISAARISPVTCDVGVGLDEHKMIRVASGDGGEEEVDGQEATTEIEVTEDANADEANVENGTTTPTAGSPSGDRTPSSAKSSSPTSKVSSAVNRKDVESPTLDKSKPASAASRSSIPEAIVYEPPERRKSATSTVSDEKKEDESEKLDEKETEKTDETSEKEVLETPEKTDEGKEKDEGTATAEAEVEETVIENKENVAVEDNKAEEISSGEQADAVKEDKETADEQSAEDLEKGAEDSHEKESAEKETVEQPSEAIASTEVTEKDAVMEEAQKEEEAEEEKDTKSELPIPETTTTENATTEPTEEEGEDKADEIKSDADAVGMEEAEKEQPKENAEIEKSETDKLECVDIVSKVLDEPKTLVEEESKLDEPSVKEESTKASEEKEEDETEKEKSPTPVDATTTEEDADVAKDEKEDQKEEEIGENEVKKDGEDEEVAGTDETAETAEKEETEQVSTQAEQEEEIATDKVAEDSKEEEEKEEELEIKTEDVAEEKAEEDQMKTDAQDEGEKTDDVEEEKKDEDAKEAEEEQEEPEPPPKSPTKRMRSPDKAGRRGSLPQLRLPPKAGNGWGSKTLPPVGRISPISPLEGVSPSSSPPKTIKTPPSPQKPQKSTSPKKKNGMLSPIKTPKTPGSDIRKLPPIKAPVGLAPNPNLKNIRSKIGSFDNIRYKPGGGDKKVISKKLDWKAAPKIGSLDHSLKEKKHSKGHSKGESKEGKAVDGQSPLPSGDEGEQEAPTTIEVAESLIKADGAATPAIIAAES